jgi:hypothetical protein
MVGVLENPVVYPGNPLCHLVEIRDDTLRALRRERDRRRNPAVGSATGP